MCRVGLTLRFPDSTKLTDRPRARVCEYASVFVVRFKWQNSLECEQVSAQYYFLGSLVGVLIQSGGERECCERLAGLAEWLVFMLCFVFCFSVRGRERLQREGRPWRGTASAASSTSCLSSISSSL